MIHSPEQLRATMISSSPTSTTTILLIHTANFYPLLVKTIPVEVVVVTVANVTLVSSIPLIIFIHILIIFKVSSVSATITFEDTLILLLEDNVLCHPMTRFFLGNEMIRTQRQGMDQVPNLSLALSLMKVQETLTEARISAMMINSFPSTIPFKLRSQVTKKINCGLPLKS